MMGIHSGEAGFAQESRVPLKGGGIRSGESGSTQESRDPLRRVEIHSGESGSTRDPLSIRSGSDRIKWDTFREAGRRSGEDDYHF